MALVTCPSGLRGEIRELSVADEDLMAGVPTGGDLSKRWTKILEQLAVRCWVRTTDAGPYPGMDNLNPERIASADLTYALIQVRSESWGDELDVAAACPRGHDVAGTVRISKCATRPMRPEVLARFREGKPIPHVVDGRRVEFWLLTRVVEERIAEAQETYPKEQATQALLARIASVEGFDPETGLDADQKIDVRTWIRGLSSRTAMELRAAMVDADPQVDTMASLTCQRCGGKVLTDILEAPGFFAVRPRMTSSKNSTP